MSFPSVRMTIWCTSSTHYAHTRKNANPHDERKYYLKQMSFWYKLFNPWLEIYSASDNKRYMIKKSEVVIIEFKWDDGDYAD